MKPNKSDSKDMYLDWVNNFHTVPCFAEHYNIAESVATDLIEHHRKLDQGARTITPLEKHVKDWAEDLAEDYDGSVAGPLGDLAEGGCQSGMVSHLVYYTDTVAFYHEYEAEISKLLSELLSDTGLSLPDLFGEKWDKEDPLILDTSNQNLLAWFGFEETAARLADSIGESNE